MAAQLPSPLRCTPRRRRMSSSLVHMVRLRGPLPCASDPPAAVSADGSGRGVPSGLPPLARGSVGVGVVDVDSVAARGLMPLRVASASCSGSPDDEVRGLFSAVPGPSAKPAEPSSSPPVALGCASSASRRRLPAGPSLLLRFFFPRAPLL